MQQPREMLVATPTSNPDEGPIATYLRCNSRPPPPFEGMQRIDVKSPQRTGVENSTRSDEDCYPRPPAGSSILKFLEDVAFGKAETAQVLE